MVWLLGMMGAITLAICFVVLSVAWAHSIWTQNSPDYATELNAQASILQARALDTEARRQEYEGMAVALGALAPVVLSIGALLTGLGWLVFLIIGGLGLLRGVFAVSRVVESRGILPRLQEGVGYATQQVLAAPDSRVAAHLRDRGLVVRPPVMDGGRGSDDQSIFAVHPTTQSTATESDPVNISRGGVVYKSPIHKSRSRKRS